MTVSTAVMSLSDKSWSLSFAEAIRGPHQEAGLRSRSSEPALFQRGPGTTTGDRAVARGSLLVIGCLLVQLCASNPTLCGTGPAPEGRAVPTSAAQAEAGDDRAVALDLGL